MTKVNLSARLNLRVTDREYVLLKEEYSGFVRDQIAIDLNYKPISFSEFLRKRLVKDA